MGPIHVAPSVQTGVEGAKKGGGRFRVCACTTACVHPYAQKGGWVVPPSHSSTPPRFTYRPYARLGGERATRFGRGLQFAQPLCMQMEGGRFHVLPPRKPGGACASGLHTALFACPLCVQTEAGRKRFIHFHPPHLRVAPACKSRVGGTASECARGPLLACRLCMREVGGGKMGGAISHSHAGPVCLLLLRANRSGGREGWVGKARHSRAAPGSRANGGEGAKGGWALIWWFACSPLFTCCRCT